MRESVRLGLRGLFRGPTARHVLQNHDAQPSRHLHRSQPTSRRFGIIERELDKRTSVISIEGELDLATAPRLKRMLIDALQAGHEELVVDLSLTTFMDSTALGVLVGVNRSLGVDARMAIVCSRSTVLKIFELSGLDGMFVICSTVDEALVYTRGHAAKAG